MSKFYTTHAALYDAAFDWDDRDKVVAIAGLSRLTSGRVLEPMCGSGRLAAAFAAEGFATIGVDSSRAMLDLAQARFARLGLEGEWLEADVRRFDLDEACDLAVCPINSLAHLPTQEAMLAHLDTIARNLYSGASYWIQLDLKRPTDVGGSETWDFDYRGETVQIEWSCGAYRDGFETHVTRYRFPDGRVEEERDAMKVWSFAEWTALLERTSFTLACAYTGAEFAPLPCDERLNGAHVFWQQLLKML